MLLSRRSSLSCALYAAAAAAQFGTIKIDWVANGALGDGVATPRVILPYDKAEAVDMQEAHEKEPHASADSYEEAWWRDGFAHDPPESWFGGSREPRGQRPPEMVRQALRVGAVYTHAVTRARGVVVGWDQRTKAPRQWLGANIPGERSWADRMRRLYAPHFSVLEEDVFEYEPPRESAQNLQN